MVEAQIFDIDGILADSSHRRQFPKKYNENFFSEVLRDKPIKKNINKINLIKNSKVIILTGRSIILKKITKMWLEENNIKYDHLLMRPRRSNCSNAIFKIRILKKIVSKKIFIHNIHDDNKEFLDSAKKLELIGLKTDD